jgi:short-subunit dehydrogenase
MNKETTLITGASSGIGLHLATEFAKHGHPLIVVAPVESELREISENLNSNFQVESVVIAKDLRDPDAALEIREELGGRAVEILVNNAGVGQKGKAWEIPLEEDLSTVRLNIEAVLRMNKAFLPAMVAQGKGRILHTASTAGFEPGPGYAVYAASKAFLLSYSEALATELEGTGITVTALCPGPTDTDFFIKADMLQTRAFQEAQLMAPQDVASAAYKALMSGDRVIVPGVVNKAFVFARRFLPESAQAKLQEALVTDVPGRKQKRVRGERERQKNEVGRPPELSRR